MKDNLQESKEEKTFTCRTRGSFQNSVKADWLKALIFDGFPKTPTPMAQDVVLIDGLHR